MEPEGLIESNWTDVVDNFDDMNLKEELLRGIYAYGFERPSAIQQRAILPCIKEHDVIAQAQSGKLFFYCAIFQARAINFLFCWFFFLSFRLLPIVFIFANFNFSQLRAALIYENRFHRLR